MQINANVDHKPDAVRLDGFHLLTYAPEQWGPGVRTEDNGTPVDDIVAAAADEPDRAKVAEAFGTTPEHVKQALAYRMMTGG